MGKCALTANMDCLTCSYKQDFPHSDHNWCYMFTEQFPNCELWLECGRLKVIKEVIASPKLVTCSRCEGTGLKKGTNLSCHICWHAGTLTEESLKRRLALEERKTKEERGGVLINPQTWEPYEKIKKL